MDSHADAVIRNFSARGTQVFRVNTEDLFDKYEIELGVDPSGVWYGSLRDEIGRELNLRDLKVAWLRRPSFGVQSSTSAELDDKQSIAEFVKSEAKALIHTLYALPNVVWINDPFISDKAKVKFQQLILAGLLGIKVPLTRITNSEEGANQFVSQCPGDILVKGIYTSSFRCEGVERGLPSIRLTKEQFAQRKDLLGLCATQFQTYVEKDFELRVTVIGDKVFATRIDSQQHEETRTDWRLRTELNPHSEFSLPTNVVAFCREFLKLQGLLYGAMDFIVTPDGEFIFLENNPSGQYLWLELETGAGLTDELCNFIEGLDRNASA